MLTRLILLFTSWPVLILLLAGNIASFVFANGEASTQAAGVGLSATFLFGLLGKYVS